MSPEQARGTDLDARSDLHSAGVILCELLVGDVPFRADNTPAVLLKHVTEHPQAPSARRLDVYVPPVFESIALKCLEKAPGARFQSAEALGEALESAARLTHAPRG